MDLNHARLPIPPYPHNADKSVILSANPLTLP